MNIIFDALASPAESGGMRLHAREVINSWTEVYPNDRLIIVGPHWITHDIASSTRVRHIPWPNESAILRVLGEMIVVPILARVVYHKFVLLSLSPVLSPLAPKSRSYVVSHDWRHLRNPHEFSAGQRLYRRIWAYSLSRAKAVFAISAKTAAEIKGLEQRATVVVVPNGRDHARRWAESLPAHDDAIEPLLLTFGHKNHKRPELAIAAVAAMSRPARLVVLGATGEYAATLRSLSRTSGVADKCEFPGFVEEDVYRALVRSARVIMLLATDDGFGLPIAEAAYFGIHSIVTSDGGLAAMHADAIVVQPSAEDLATALDRCLDSSDRPDCFVGWTWREAVDRMRATIALNASELQSVAA